MRSFAACAVVVGSMSALARADVIAQNAPVVPYTDPVTGRQLRDGTFSDGLSSNGNYYYSRSSYSAIGILHLRVTRTSIPTIALSTRVCFFSALTFSGT